MTYPEEGGRDFRDDAAEPGDGWPSDRVDRNDMAERSREGLAGGFLSAVRRTACGACQGASAAGSAQGRSSIDPTRPLPSHASSRSSTAPVTSTPVHRLAKTCPYQAKPGIASVLQTARDYRRGKKALWLHALGPQNCQGSLARRVGVRVYPEVGRPIRQGAEALVRARRAEPGASL